MEVLATMLLLGIVLPAISTGISVSLAAADTARHRVTAARLAQEKLTELTLSPTWGGGGISGEFGSEYGEYRWQAILASREGNMEELTVAVTWSERGSDRVLFLSTLLYEGKDQ
jgi:hypothetical protein